MRKKKKGVRAGDIAFNAFLYAFAGITLLIVLYPLYFILIASFSDPTLVTNGEVLLWPKGLNVDGYIELGKRADFWIGYRNTIAYTVLGVLVGLAVNVPVAYAFSRKDLVGRRLLNAYYMFTMFFNGGLIPTYTVGIRPPLKNMVNMFFNGGLIPTYTVILNFGLYDSFWVLILPFSVSVYNIIVARMFFSTNLPADLWDAACIDGCGNLRYFFQIALPLSKAMLAVIGLWTAVTQWNSYYNALIYIRNDNLVPLQLVLRNILIINQSQANMLGNNETVIRAMRLTNLLKYVVIIVSTVPILCAYPFVQKYFNQGFMLGAVKG